VNRKDEARQARALIELALDGASHAGRWPWSRRLSLWLDTLVILEERAGG
jgi:hypothetical protein